ncbi:ATP-binding protein [Piscinibacter terrae]|uniref:Virulence sensor protein BvgS n=1 Tax=Piscinibacter terrae TaxID=2496871 RepID=A0A3N7HPB0_9BURK|nr:ATP-binding protein [Albitalea terrae]RQP23980.1 response regulator [Albitalea terrae]
MSGTPPIAMDTSTHEHTLPPAKGEFAEQLADEQLRMVWEHASIGTLVATAFALLMAWKLPTHFPQYVLPWLGLKLAIALPRIVQAMVYNRRGHPGGKRWRNYTYGLLAIDGIVWGLAGAVLVHDTIGVASVILPCLTCVAIVATYGLQARVTATAAYVVPIILMSGVSVLFRGDEFGVLWGLGSMALLGLLLSTARRYERRLAENFLLRMKASRSEEMKDAALALAQRNAEEREHALQLAQRKSAVKSQFLATMSHELRTPLHGILGIARLLHIESNDSAVQRRVELIESSGMHLLELINDLLDIGRIESGQLKIAQAEFDVASEAHRVAEIYAVRAGDKGLSFSFDCRVKGECWVLGDPSRLRQVLHNLLGNAVKFTKTGFVSMSLEHLGGEDYVFVVRDSGVGISPEDQAHIFEAFRQVGATAARPFEGTGLGLTIAREVAQAMGGDITCRSATDVGSSFRFTIKLKPMAQASQAAGDTSDMPAPAVQRGEFQVLLAEDNDLNALIAQAFLEREGVVVERAVNGREAVRRALREVGRPNLVLMDVLMPGLDGVAATREIRAREQALGLSRVPVIAMTATASDEDREACLAAGMDEFLPKPFSAEQLGRIMAFWLHRPGASALGLGTAGDAAPPLAH